MAVRGLTDSVLDLYVALLPRVMPPTKVAGAANWRWNGETPDLSPRDATAAARLTVRINDSGMEVDAGKGWMIEECINQSSVRCKLAIRDATPPISTRP